MMFARKILFPEFKGQMPPAHSLTRLIAYMAYYTSSCILTTDNTAGC